MLFHVENLVVRIYSPGGEKYLTIKDELFYAKNKSSLRHVIGYHALSTFGYDKSYYDFRGTSYHNKGMFTITPVTDPITPRTKYKYFKGTMYVLSDAKHWVPIPDADVTPEMFNEMKGGE